MSDATSMARRYHWLSDSVENYVSEPHTAICCDGAAPTLNLVAASSAAVRSASAALAAEKPEVALKALTHLLEVMRNALNGAKIDRSEKVRAFRRLAGFAG